MNAQHTRFLAEIRHFHLVSLLNLIFAALAIAFGVSFMVSAVAGQVPGTAGVGFRILTGAIAMAGFGLGIGWLLATIRIYEGVERIRNSIGRGSGTNDDRTTCHIIRMLALYRDNRDMIRRMILVCTLGGTCFFILAIAGAIEQVTITPSGGSITMNSLIAIPGLILTLGIALVSLFSSWYFSRFADAWDHRLDEIDDAEGCLKKTLGMVKE